MTLIYSLGAEDKYPLVTSLFPCCELLFPGSGQHVNFMPLCVCVSPVGWATVPGLRLPCVQRFPGVFWLSLVITEARLTPPAGKLFLLLIMC